MPVLALDTSTPAVTVAVTDATRVLAELTEVAANRHGELLAPLVDRVLAASGVARAQLRALAVGVGPGPFTGLRVGIVTAAALADALAVPADPVCSLDVLAALHGAPCVAVTDARRKEVYWAEYGADGDRDTGPCVDTPAGLAQRLGGRPVPVVGAGALLYRDALAGYAVVDTDPYPRAGALGRLVADRVAAGEPGEALMPMYLRRPDALPPGRPKPVTPLAAP